MKNAKTKTVNNQPSTKLIVRTHIKAGVMAIDDVGGIGKVTAGKGTGRG